MRWMMLAAIVAGAVALALMPLEPRARPTSAASRSSAR